MAVADVPMKPIGYAPEAGSQRLSAGPQADQASKLSYMQRPPTILPNYGSRWKHGPRLKTNLPRVLLYDNVTQQTILDAKITYIQSQRYKSSRHLDMNIKSFLLWKQRKEKALLKLTQVQHGYDYANFELDYDGGVSLPDKTTSANCNNSFVLPNIQPEKPRRITVTTSQQDNGKEKRKDCLPGLACVFMREQQATSSGLPSHSAQENKSNHLPSIKNKIPSEVTNNSGLETNSPLPLVQQRNTKPQFEHNSSDVMSFTEPLFNTLMTSHNQVFMKSPTVKINISTNPADDNESSHAADTLKTNPEKHCKEINNIGIYNKNSKESQRNKQVKMKQPVFDSRFLRLQNILVPQRPRNEGFTLLSPSFKNKKYFHFAK